MNDSKSYLDDLKAELNKYTKTLSSIQNSFKGKAGKDIEKILQSLQSLLHEAGVAYARLESASVDEWEPMKKIAAQSFKKLRTSFDTFLSASSEQLKDYAHQAEDYSQEKLDCTADYIKKNPFKSILLAAGLGFIMGRILK